MEELIKSNSPLMSSDVRAIAQALLLAKKKFRATGKSALNAHQKYKYAVLSDIYDAVEDALAENNIIINHGCEAYGVEPEILRTRLIHTLTGQYMEDQRRLEYEKAGGQAKGAANTYVRKTAVLSLCAISPEDDDGEEEETYLQNLVAKAKKAIEGRRDKSLMNRILENTKVKKIEQLRADQLEAIINKYK